MTNKLYVILLSILALANSSSLQSALLPLPASLNNKPIYYPYAQQINKWSCGYNALYNACKLEHESGRANSNSDIENFKATCLPYLSKHGINPSDASVSSVLIRLAKPLRLDRLNYLTLSSDNRVKPLFDTSTGIRYPANSSAAQVNKLMEQARKDREDRLMMELIQEFKNAQAPYISHFICQVNDLKKAHAILVSVVKEQDGTAAIHIYDNTNSSITENSQIKQFIDYLYANFMTNNGQFNYKQKITRDHQNNYYAPHSKNAKNRARWYSLAYYRRWLRKVRRSLVLTIWGMR